MLFNLFFHKKQNRDKIEAFKNVGEVPAEELNDRLDKQFEQLPGELKCIRNILLKNPEASAGYSFMDGIVISPYCIFLITHRCEEGTIDGRLSENTWFLNEREEIENPFISMKERIKALKPLVDTRYHNSFISMVSFKENCTFKIDPGLCKMVSNELVVHEQNLAEYIHRKLFVARFQHTAPLITETVMESMYQTISSNQISPVKGKEKHRKPAKKH
ncbi:nuclease-related domain-containing protein [Salibacterium aidingense]|uniref:nuclease-related domain-containing protein n=1 Tax=Salibacterium aidingense TaxID=384933 RepID=UPI003BCBD4CC